MACPPGRPVRVLSEARGQAAVGNPNSKDGPIQQRRGQAPVSPPRKGADLMDELLDQGIHSSVGDKPNAECASEADGVTSIPASPLTQEEMQAAINEPAYAKKAEFWSARLSRFIGDRSSGKEDYSQEIFRRVMSEWKRVKGLRPGFKYVAHKWVKSFACKIIRESEAQKRGNEKKKNDIFGRKDEKVMDLPASSACSNEMMEDVLDEAEGRFSGNKREIVSLLRKGFTGREIQSQLEERWNPGTQGRSDPDFKKCSLGTISKVRKEFIAIAREIHFGFRLS